MRKKYDVSVIGGGPIGGNIAKQIADRNYKVAVFEKNKKIGEPLKCAGLVTPRVFDYVDFKKETVLQNRIKGANIHSPSGQVLKIGGDKVHALVIDRASFDNKIVENAKKKGVDVYLDNKVLSAQKNQGLIELVTSKKLDFECKLLIGADGPYSNTRDIFSLPAPNEYLMGVGGEFSGTCLDSDFVEIFVGNNVAPGFFAWIIPLNKQGTIARVGLCVKQDAVFPAKHYFEDFLKNKNVLHFLKDAKLIRRIGGVVPLGVLKKTYSSNVMIAGDAAAQVKPTSGGGIYTGLLSGRHCSSIAVQCLEKNDFSTQFLKNYHKQWSADIGAELSMGMKFRRLFRNMSDKQMDKYIVKFQNPKIVEVITKYGDIDHPSKLMKPLLKKSPSLIKLIPNMIK